TLRDDLLARLDAVGDDPIEAIARPRGDVAHLDDVVRADHRHLRRSLKVAYGGLRYDGCVDQILHRRSYLGVAARPQDVLGVREEPLERQRAGARIDLTANHGDRAAVRIDRTVGQ